MDAGTVPVMDDAQAWAEQRRRAITAHAAALERERETAVAQARELLAEFIREAERRGIAPHPLRVRVPGRRLTYRTGVTGWYLRRDGSLGVDVTGAFYHLDAPPRLSSWLLGVRLTPSDPPLRVGVGARDGESMPLRELLERRLAEAG